eukprot:505618-Prorocentrum_minimum.AAC.1
MYILTTDQSPGGGAPPPLARCRTCACTSRGRRRWRVPRRSPGSPAQSDPPPPVYSHDGPIRRRKRGCILTTDQSDAGAKRKK